MTRRDDARGITRNGLRVDAAKQAAWQRRAAEAYAVKQRARRNAAAHTSRIARRPKPGNDWPLLVRKMAARRSGGACEIDPDDPAQHLHHRKPRRHGDHTIANALHLCEKHHRLAHTDPRRYELGWLIHAADDPAAIPVEIDGVGRIYLTPDGDYREAA